ncbi:MAG: 4-hydroxythreonine-4-phosphate dehydrogenase PdxA [Gammaproteobacteria bacterium]|nr:4-hydroxythreonine-4-phosphate dehydrogenase PdxA [Gammaproteobacteria bacterium]
MEKIPVIALTPGEPAGIGPNLCVLLAQKKPVAHIVVIGDPDLLRQRAHEMDVPLSLTQWEPSMATRPGMSVLPVKLKMPVRAGTLDVANASYVIETLEMAIKGCLDHRFDALVTGPVNKGVINDAGIDFTGHTEFLSARCHCKRVVMMLATDRLRVALATTHLPLKEVSDHIQHDMLTDVITILHRELITRFAIDHPRILVCGLNPHAGENGHLGREEIDVIQPVVEQLRALGINLTGPIPADSAFTPARLTKADAVLAMYHDQGLPVLKYAGFGQAVNITLGLPFVRTSVDHGTALDRVRDNGIDTGSLEKAIDTALAMVAR